MDKDKETSVSVAQDMYISGCSCEDYNVLIKQLGETNLTKLMSFITPREVSIFAREVGIEQKKLIDFWSILKRKKEIYKDIVFIGNAPLDGKTTEEVFIDEEINKKNIVKMYAGLRKYILAAVVKSIDTLKKKDFIVVKTRKKILNKLLKDVVNAVFTEDKKRIDRVLNVKD